jgi:hypothetical protein
MPETIQRIAKATTDQWDGLGHSTSPGRGNALTLVHDRHCPTQVFFFVTLSSFAEPIVTPEPRGVRTGLERLVRLALTCACLHLPEYSDLWYHLFVCAMPR